MTPADNDEQDKVLTAQQGPGSLLKKARERHGFSAASVAAQLHLQIDIINGLERDDYDSLPGPVFVQGYLRNYARLLGLKEDAVVAAYQRQFPENDEQSLLNSPQRSDDQPMHSDHSVMRLVTWGIVVGLGALLFFWWQTRVELEPPEPFPISQESLPETALPVDANIDEEHLDGLQPEPLIPDDSESVSEEVTTAAPQSDIAEASIAGDPVQAEIDSDAALEPVELPAEPQGSDLVPLQAEPEVVAEQASAPVESRSKSLLFSFEGPCWTEVRSLDGKARIIGEMRDGVKRRLSSEFGPFNVVLGDASVVTLTIDGQPFDINPFVRGKVARFTLDPDKL
jgi:cytoskeleton protein RodZ